MFAGASRLKSLTCKRKRQSRAFDDKAVVYNADRTEIVMMAPGVSYNGYTFASTLKSLGRGIFSGRTEIGDLDLSNTSIEVIGDYAFYGCTGLTEIIFPETLKRIGEGAFGVCYNLFEINIPAGVEVGARAYYNCVQSNSQGQIVSGPNKITIGDNAVIGQEAFAVCEGVFSLELGNDVTLGVGAFYLCSNLGRGTVELGNLTEIPESCFGMNLSLENIDLSGVKKIGANAFSTNYNGQVTGGSLTEIDLSSVEELGDYAFFGQTSLEDVTLGSELKEINKYAFAYCVTLTEINLDNVEIIREGAFFNNIGSVNLTDTYPGAGLTELDMPNLRIVEAGAFEYAIWVEKVNMPKVEEVGEMAFSGLLATATDSSGNQWNVILSSLKEVTLPTDSEIDVVLNNGAFYLSGSLETINCERVVSMGDAVFMYCMSVKEINAPECTQIGEMCFYEAESATKIHVPLIEEVPDGAFFGTEALTSVELPDVVRFGDGAFNGTGLESFTFTQKEIESIGDGVFAYAENLHEFTRTVNGKTTDSFNLGSGYFVEDGVLYGTLPNGGYQLISYPAQKEDRVYTVLDNTVRIGTGAGAGSAYLEVLVLPRTLKTIGDSAFYDCEKLKTIEFRSYLMPELEGIKTNDATKASNNVGDIFQPGENIVYYNMAYEAVWYLYYNLGGQLGVAEDIVAIVPENGVGYDNWLTDVYFDYIIKGANAKADETVFAEELINALPGVRNMTLKDETAVVAARAAYNAIPTAEQRSMIASAYNTLVAAEERIKELKASSTNPGEPTDPETPVVDEKDETIKKLKTTVIVLAIVAGVIALGFVAYVVFDIVRKNKAVCAEAKEVEDKKEE
ncbi:MAG: leucine-rich repeat protein [Lachnospiraceae bacterium]